MRTVIALLLVGAYISAAAGGGALGNAPRDPEQVGGGKDRGADQTPPVAFRVGNALALAALTGLLEIATSDAEREQIIGRAGPALGSVEAGLVEFATEAGTRAVLAAAEEQQLGPAELAEMISADPRAEAIGTLYALRWRWLAALRGAQCRPAGLCMARRRWAVLHEKHHPTQNSTLAV